MDHTATFCFQKSTTYLCFDVGLLIRRPIAIVMLTDPLAYVVCLNGDVSIRLEPGKRQVSVSYTVPLQAYHYKPVTVQPLRHTTTPDHHSLYLTYRTSLDAYTSTPIAMCRYTQAYYVCQREEPGWAPHSHPETKYDFPPIERCLKANSRNEAKGYVCLYGPDPRVRHMNCCARVSCCKEKVQRAIDKWANYRDGLPGKGYDATSKQYGEEAVRIGKQHAGEDRDDGQPKFTMEENFSAMRKHAINIRRPMKDLSKPDRRTFVGWKW